MRKPAELRRVLEAHVASIKADPAKLSVFIDKGRIAASAKPGKLGFQYLYTLNVVVQDYGGDVDALIVPVLAWIAESQPDLLARSPQEPFRFESEILEDGAADVSIYIELSEGVLVTPKEGGGFDTEHLAEPQDSDAFDGVCGPLLWQIVLNGAVVAQTANPAFQP